MRFILIMHTIIRSTKERRCTQNSTVYTVFAETKIHTLSKRKHDITLSDC